MQHREKKKIYQTTIDKNLWLECNTTELQYAKVQRSFKEFLIYRELTNCLEALENVGYTEERALLMLAYAQIGGVA